VSCEGSYEHCNELPCFIRDTQLSALEVSALWRWLSVVMVEVLLVVVIVIIAVTGEGGERGGGMFLIT
jgi:hypothetical protein